VGQDPDAHAAFAAQVDEVDPLAGPARTTARLPDRQEVGVEGAVLEIRDQLSESLTLPSRVTAGTSVVIAVRGGVDVPSASLRLGDDFIVLLIRTLPGA